jgi:hypothetical protein
MLGSIKSLEKGQVDIRSEVFLGFDSMRRFAGVSLEEFVKNWMSGSLRERGILPAGISLERAVVDGEEINLFSKDPLIVGGITAYAESVEEISELLRKAEAAKKKYKREPRYLFLRVLTAPSSVAEEMKKIAKAKNRPRNRKGILVRITKRGEIQYFRDNITILGSLTKYNLVF